jgi:hypothetical protein
MHTFLEQNAASKAVIHVPEVYARYAAFKVPAAVSLSHSRCPTSPNKLGGRHEHTHSSLYTSKASFALTSIFRMRSLGVTPSSMGGSNSLLHGLRQLSPSRL